MKKTLILFVTILLFVSLPRTSIFASTSLGFTKGDTIESGTLTEGITYEKFEGTSMTDYGTEGSQHVSLITAASDAPFEIAVWSKLSGNSVIGSDMIELATDYELNHPGYEVIAGINGDYFNPSNSAPINALVQDGDTVKYTNFYLDRYFSVGFTNDDSLFISNKSNTIDDSFYLSIYADDGVRIIKEVKVQGLNQPPQDEQTTIYYKPLNTVNLSDSYGFMASVDVDTQLDSLLLKATLTESTVTVPALASTVTIVTKDESLIPYLTSNTLIRMQKPMAGVYQGIDAIIGVGSQPLLDGSIKSFEEINDQNVDFSSARHPRTTFGFTANGDFLIATFDGRQTGMSGVNLREMAYAMNTFGALDAFNLDGGGSTQMIIKEGDHFKMLNSPSEVPYRNVSNGLFIVRPAVSVTTDVSNETESSFDFTYDFDENFGSVSSVNVYLNDALQDSTTTQYSFTDLQVGEIYYVSVIVNYTIDDIDYTTTFASKRIDLSEFTISEEPHVKLPPSNFQVDITNDDGIAGFTVFITFDDPDNTFKKMYLLYDDNRIICSKAIGGYSVSVPFAEEGRDYAIKLEYFYQINTITPVSEITASTFFYHYQTHNDDDNPVITTNPITPPETPEEPQENPLLWYGIIAGGVAVIGTVVIFVMKRK